MPESISIDLYQYSELSDKAKEKAKEWYYEAFGDQSDELADYFENDLPNWGFPEVKVKEFSFSYSQSDDLGFKGPIDFDALLAAKDTNDLGGDDASYYTCSEYVNACAAIRAAMAFLADHSEEKNADRYAEINESPAFVLAHRGGGSYSQQVEFNIGAYCSAHDDDDFMDEAEKHNEAVYKALKELGIYLRRAFMKAAYKIIEFHSSNEAIAGCMEANEYTFLKDGTRFG
jgi:hypothetical protein